MNPVMPDRESRARAKERLVARARRLLDELSLNSFPNILVALELHCIAKAGLEYCGEETLAEAKKISEECEAEIAIPEPLGPVN